MTGDQVTHLHPAAAFTVTARHQLPAPPADFTGRAAELAELLTKFEGPGPAISALQGTGGAGKTALALQLAEMIKGRYPDAQLYLDLRGTGPQPLTPAEAMAHVIRAYHPGMRLPRNDFELRALYLSVLQDQRALLLLDNARDRLQVEPLIPPAGCALLITSRQSLALPGIFARRLDCLSPLEARQLLLTLAPQTGELVGVIARLCGQLPLALRLAAGAISERPNLKPADYTRRLASRQKQAELIEASLSLSYEMLSPELQRRWRTLAVFPEGFDEPGAAAVWEAEEGTTQDLLGELLAFNLVEWNRTTERYRLHDLARAFADSRMNRAERETGQRRHARHYQLVLAAADYLYRQGGEETRSGLAMFDRERANIEAGQAWAARQAGSDEGAAELCLTYPDAGTHVLALRQPLRERIQWSAAMLVAARSWQRAGAENRALGNLVYAHATLGEFRRALEFAEQRLEITRRIGDRRSEGQALGNLGQIYEALGEPRSAIRYLERQFVIAHELNDRRVEGLTLNSLGHTYHSLGETVRAIKFFEQARIVAGEIGDRRTEGQALGNLGWTCLTLGETGRAVEFFARRLAIARETGDRRGESQTLNHLGIAYNNRGRGVRAIRFLMQALLITRELGDRRGEGQTLGNLGLAYLTMERAERAIELFDQHLTIARETGNPQGEGQALSNLGEAYGRLGEPERAIQHFEQALRIFRQTANRKAQRQALRDLGEAYATLGETRRALEFFEQDRRLAVEIGNRLGEGRALNNLGQAYHALGDFSRALLFFEQALTLAQEIGDRGTEGRAIWNTALTLHALGEFAPAIASAETALRIYEQLESSGTEEIRNKLAEWKRKGDRGRFILIQ
ncbi:MAG TPA: tetratricopeptide repeat protein [Blastocatellia bacterium]|nr:tetratricopeptide repeat protein [Blastocatellia bacterium]